MTLNSTKMVAEVHYIYDQYNQSNLYFNGEKKSFFIREEGQESHLFKIFGVYLTIKDKVKLNDYFLQNGHIHKASESNIGQTQNKVIASNIKVDGADFYEISKYKIKEIIECASEYPRECVIYARKTLLSDVINSTIYDPLLLPIEEVNKLLLNSPKHIIDTNSNNEIRFSFKKRNYSNTEIISLFKTFGKLHKISPQAIREFTDFNI